MLHQSSTCKADERGSFLSVQYGVETSNHQISTLLQHIECKRHVQVTLSLEPFLVFHHTQSSYKQPAAEVTWTTRDDGTNNQHAGSSQANMMLSTCVSLRDGHDILREAILRMPVLGNLGKLQARPYMGFYGRPSSAPVIYKTQPGWKGTRCKLPAVTVSPFRAGG